MYTNCFDIDELLDEALYDDAYLQEERNDAVRSMNIQEPLITQSENNISDGDNTRVSRPIEFAELEA